MSVSTLEAISYFTSHSRALVPRRALFSRHSDGCGFYQHLCFRRRLVDTDNHSIRRTMSPARDPVSTALGEALFIDALLYFMFGFRREFKTFQGIAVKDNYIENNFIKNYYFDTNSNKSHRDYEKGNKYRQEVQFSILRCH